MTGVFGSRNQRLIKRYGALVAATPMPSSRRSKRSSDDALRAKTAEFKQRYAGGEDLDALLPEAFARRARGGAAHARACGISTSS